VPPRRRHRVRDPRRSAWTTRWGARGAGAVVVASVLSMAGAARASLTPSESEQVRRDVMTGTHVAQVRALVARPDLTPAEAQAAIAVPLTTTPIDSDHAAFLHELVFSDASTASRPVLAVVVVQALVARADTVLADHALDIERRPAALDELRRVYSFIEEIASAAPTANIPVSSREQCALALRGHVARNAALVGPQSPVGPFLAQARAQAAIAVLDLTPGGPTRRIDVADALGLSEARRGLLVERGVLLLDAGSADARAASARVMLDRLLPARDPLEAILVSGDPARLVAHDGPIAAVVDPQPGSTLWGSDVEPPPVDDWTTAVARGLAPIALARATGARPDLVAQIEHDGGADAVAPAMAMLAIDAPRSVQVAAVHFSSGHPETAAVVFDAIGALLALAPPAPHGPAASIPVGPARGGATPAHVIQIALNAAGAAKAFRLEGHAWSIERDVGGAVTVLRRDGARLPVPAAPR
jgi:hypothetical protein